MAKEGIEVVQANNHRVAAAKKAVAWTAQNLQAANVSLKAARKTVEAAQKTHIEAAKELKDAEQSQKAALKKWEVIDLFQDDEEMPKSSDDSKKRAEVPSDSEANVSKKVRSDSDFAEEVTVEGCGLAEVNGTYKRDGNRCGSPRYSKKGQWKGENVWFHILYKATGNFWHIVILRSPRSGRIAGLYYNQDGSLVPPSDGWFVYNSGVEPPPKITLNP